MKDVSGAMERPGGCAIDIVDTGDVVIAIVPARPLGILWAVFIFNVAALILFAVLGLLYLIYHLPLIDGLPLTSPKANSPEAARWFAGFGAGWLAAQSALVYGFCLVWFPLMTGEKITMNNSGIAIVKKGPIRRITFQSDWLNVAEIVLSRDHERIRQSRLVITLLSGADCVIAETAAEADREWLASVCHVCAARFEQPNGPASS